MWNDLLGVGLALAYFASERWLAWHGNRPSTLRRRWPRAERAC